MYRLNPDCWVWSPRPPLIPLHSGTLASAMQSHQGEEDEEGGELPAVCCYTTGCDDIIGQASGAHWSNCEPPAHSGIPTSSGLSGLDSGAPSSHLPITVIEADQGDELWHFIDGHHWEGPRMETQGCVCVYGQREPEALGPCWPGSPFIYCGVRRNMVVGVEVVEEVAVEDTLEVITEDVYAGDLLDPEGLQDDQQYPT